LSTAYCSCHCSLSIDFQESQKNVIIFEKSNFLSNLFETDKFLEGMKGTDKQIASFYLLGVLTVTHVYNAMMEMYLTCSWFPSFLQCPEYLGWHLL